MSRLDGLIAAFRVEAASKQAASWAARYKRQVFGRDLSLFFRLLDGLHLHSPPEQVHDLRVQARRLAEHLELLQAFVSPPLLLAGRDFLEHLMTALGPVRNADEARRSLQATLQRDLSVAEREAILLLDRQLMKRRTRRLQESLAYLTRSDTWERLAFLENVRRQVLRTRADKARFSGVLAGHLALRVSEAAEKVRRGASLTSDKELHALRIAFRRLRYTAEAAHALARRPSAFALERLRSLQRVLGSHHDFAVLLRRIARAKERLDKKDPATPMIEKGLERLAVRFGRRQQSRLRAFHRMLGSQALAAPAAPAAPAAKATI